jgi:predicted nucleic acid-binding protein
VYLVDTDVISEARKGAQGNAGVRAFFSQASRDGAELYLSAVTIGELRKQITATALIHDLEVISRNVARYAPTGVRVRSPFT